MAKVIERTFKGDDAIDFPSTFEAADLIAGRRLDRRHSYAIINGEVCTLIQWSSTCSGCSSDDPSDDRGYGCHECGHTGRVRNGQWIPIAITQAQDL